MSVDPKLKRRGATDWLTPLILIAGVMVVIWWTFAGGRAGPAPDTVGWRSDFEAAAAEAVAEGRPMLVYFGADWCGACKQLVHESIPDSTVSTLIRDRTVPVKVDLTRSGGPADAIARSMQIDALPTLVIWDPQAGLAKARTVGAMPATELARWLTGALPPTP